MLLHRAGDLVGDHRGVEVLSGRLGLIQRLGLYGDHDVRGVEETPRRQAGDVLPRP